MNVVEFNPKWRTNIAFCFVDNTRSYASGIRELIKNQADGVLANIYNKGYPVYQWMDEDVLLKHVSTLGYSHAVMFSTGTEFTNGSKFFEAIEELIQIDFLVAGHILDRKDAYYELHHQCYVINLFHYNMLGQPAIGKQELGAVHQQTIPYRTSNNYHDDYTPRAIINGSKNKEYVHKCHGWNILSTAFDNDVPVIVFDDSIRENKIHFYPENPKDFYKQLGWAYHRLNYCHDIFVHTSNTETVDLPPKKYKQIVTPASGMWFKDYLASDATVVMYDYNQSSLNYWQTCYPEYKFVLCDLLGKDNLVDHIDTSIPDTLINLSNIFNYEGTVFFYSLEYRKYKQQVLVDAIQSAMPSASVYFSLQAELFDTVPTWHF